MTTPRTKRSMGILIAFALVTGVLVTNVAIGAAQAVPENGMVCSAGADVTLDAKGGQILTPDGNAVFMWSYGLGDGGEFQNPGPTICVTEGDTVDVTLVNHLPEPTSLIFPGQTGVSDTGGTAGLLATEVAPGGSITYSFAAGEPGTYLYESGTNTAKQIQMGLYGALVVRPTLGANYAYDDPTTRFDPDREFLLLLAEIDPVLHRAVERGAGYTPTTRHDRYWTINGRMSTDTLSRNYESWLPTQPYGALVQIEAGAAQPALIRYLNAGSENHPFHPHGNTMAIVGRDGSPLGAASFENFSTTVGSGQTFDLLFRWDNVEDFSATGNLIPQNDKFPFPNLGNLVFKDDATWYSGDEYLGVQGDFPTGVTSFNQCGEFYFPWHSHALHEVQNWNEGFGGMLTLVRVDPPGGC